jgi:ubiquinone/menaquinone biosynthesis C-methylase UbiE
MPLDASNMDTFPDAHFDAVVFSFNGIDTQHPKENRVKCVRECHRVLRNQGGFVFSEHNAKFLPFRPNFVPCLWHALEGPFTGKSKSYLFEVYRHIRFVSHK